MVFSMVFLFLFVVSCAAVLFFFFGFFVPALRLRYEDIGNVLSSEEYVDGEEVSLSARREAERAEFSRAMSESHMAVYAKIDGVRGGEGERGGRRLSYSGERSCALLYREYGSEFSGPDVCLGFGDCARVCPQDSIEVVGGVARVSSMCDGCGKCVEACPVGLVSLTGKKPGAAGRGFRFWKSLYRAVHGGK